MSVENMPPGFLGAQIQELTYAITELGDPDRLGICLDTGHAFITGAAPYALVDELKDYLQIVHLSDNLGDFDAHLPPYEGNIDWELFMAALCANGLRPMMIMEVNGIEHLERLPTLIDKFTKMLEQR